jgi:cytochrome c oxidase subunit 2
VLFLLFAAAALFWVLNLLRWAFAVRVRSAGRLIVAASCLAAVAAAASIGSDVHAIRAARIARRSDVEIRIVRRGSWWQLLYSRNGVSFATANEMHIPRGSAVRLQWSAVRQPFVDHALCVSDGGNACVLVAEHATARVRFVSLWPPMWRELRVVAEPADAFEQWFRNEMRSATVRTGPGPMLFETAGCGYCHVIRGVNDDSPQIAPDLTHFAARRTIAGTAFPVTRAYVTGWIAHSRGLKSDSGMPDNAIDPRVLHPLVSYLQSLR